MLPLADAAAAAAAATAAATEAVDKAEEEEDAEDVGVVIRGLTRWVVEGCPLPVPVLDVVVTVDVLGDERA